MILLGNLGIAEIEKRVGVEFSDELRDFMRPRHQWEAEDIQPGKWHCFDMPFVLACGDVETAEEIARHLSPFADDFREVLKITAPKQPQTRNGA